MVIDKQILQSTILGEWHKKLSKMKTLALLAGNSPGK
jgi:hypothetical protein